MEESPLSRFTHADLVEEFRRRHVAYVIAIMFIPEGKRVPEFRADHGCKSGGAHETLGLAKLALDAISAVVQANSSVIPYNSLEPPAPPKPPGIT